MQRSKRSGELADFHYTRLADTMADRIRTGVYKSGEKLPSLRKVHQDTGLSISTVYQAYIELEKRGVIEPKLKSGFYVKPVLKHVLPAPGIKKHRAVPKKVAINALATTIVESMSDPRVLQLGGVAPAPELLPAKHLFRSMRPGPGRNTGQVVTGYEYPTGMTELKRQIAKRTIGGGRGGGRKIGPDDIIITNGCMEAINICLRAVARAGDIILVESPTFHLFLQLIEDLHMFALELPADPAQGIDLESLDTVLGQNKVKACILIPNFHNPMGYVMSPSKKRALLECLTEKRIPVIEDDIYGDLYFGKSRPPALKSFDQGGDVLYCSSFSKTLAPGLRVGWTIPGKYYDRVKRIKFNTSISSPGLNQLMVSEYLKTGSYDRHLRRLRNALKNQISNFALAIARYFPADTKITAPQGGLILWVQLNKRVNGLAVYYEAQKHGISIFPGIIFSSSNKYRNCIRINCGYPWNDVMEKGIVKLSEIIASF